MRIAVVGSGYVGLVSGACFADFGHSVACVDLDEAKIAALQQGQIPIYEPGLEQLVAENAKAGRLTFSTNVEQAVAEAEVVFIAVGTPSRRGDGHADLSYVYEAARTIGRSIQQFTVVVTKSTVPVGTGDEVERLIREVNPSADFAVVSNPEFLREGAAIQDFKHPDRIVVGLDNDRAKQVMAEVYRPLFLNQSPLNPRAKLGIQIKIQHEILLRLLSVVGHPSPFNAETRRKRDRDRVICSTSTTFGFVMTRPEGTQQHE